MSTCNRCSQQTTRSGLCRQCALDARYGQALIAESDEPEEETLTIECADCGLVRSVGALERKTCPDCGYDGYRTLEVAR